MKSALLIIGLVLGCVHPALADPITVRGNAEVDTATLRKVMACDTCKTVDQVAAAVEAYYLANGYLLATARGSATTITIVEDHRFALGTIAIVEPGATDALGDPARLATALGLQPRQPFLRTTITAAIDAVRRRYAAAGYPAASVVPITTVHAETHTVELRFEVDRGPRASAP